MRWLPKRRRYARDVAPPGGDDSHWRGHRDRDHAHRAVAGEGGDPCAARVGGAGAGSEIGAGRELAGGGGRIGGGGFDATGKISAEAFNFSAVGAMREVAGKKPAAE